MRTTQKRKTRTDSWTIVTKSRNSSTVIGLALTGRLPFDGTSHEAILIAKGKNSPFPFHCRQLEAPLSESAERTIMKALPRQPEERFESCIQFANAFSEISARASLAPSWAELAAAVAGLAILIRPVQKREALHELCRFLLPRVLIRARGTISLSDG